MALTHETEVRNAYCTALNNEIGASGHLVIIDSSGPTDLVRLPMSTFAFAAPSNGTMSTNSIPETNAIATGNADQFQIRIGPTGLAKLSGTVATSGGDLTMLETAIATGEPVRVQSAITYTAPV